MVFYAHTLEGEPEEKWQRLADHLRAVAQMASGFADAFDMGKAAYYMGLMHDIGKYSIAFQNRIRGCPDKVDHSTAGAQEAFKQFHLLGKILSFGMAGHHGGLLNGGRGSDFGFMENRLDKSDIPSYEHYSEEIQRPELNTKEFSKYVRGNTVEAGFSLAFLTRMLFSCLVDADYLDTEKFMSYDKYLNRAAPIQMTTLLDLLNCQLERKFSKCVKNKINVAREKILNECRISAHNLSGLHTLTVPTGGGKTLSSMAYALEHAVHNKKSRIIYVIPYCSIIEQNAQVFREIFGDKAILEHHSNYDYPEGKFDEWDEGSKKHRLAAENWDMPIIVTTAVQFFESLFASKTSRCRKLHNMTNSVIILDEAQMMPIDYLKPCLYAICELIQNYNVDVVLCTATQPAVLDYLPYGIKPNELMSDVSELQDVFRRTKFHFISELGDEQLSEIIANEDQVLCIVNTRRHAAKLFQAVTKRVSEEGLFHLSARMCPVHRSQVLTNVRERLMKNQTCKVISTQLIEAGVDVDFPTVYRADAGIESIAQAAGRCNREGLRSSGDVFIFKPEPHGMPKLGDFALCADIMRRTTSRHQEDPFGLAAIHSYFEELYDWHGDRLDKKLILRKLKQTVDQLSFPFAEIGRDFSFIENTMISIVIPFNDAIIDMKKKIQHHPYPSVFSRELQRYTVQVYPFEFEALQKAGAVGFQKTGEVFWFLEDMHYYERSGAGLLDAKEVTENIEVLVF